MATEQKRPSFLQMKKVIDEPASIETREAAERIFSPNGEICQESIHKALKANFMQSEFILAESGRCKEQAVIVRAVIENFDVLLGQQLTDQIDYHK